MAFSNGMASVEANEIKKYIGVAPVYVIGVNPNKSELEKIFNRTLEKDPEYINVVKVGEDNHEVKNVRIDFIVKTDEEKCNIDFTSKVSFFIRKEYRFNRDKTKVQVIDKYGRTCWVTVEQAKAKEIPMYSNGPANIDKDYRPCYVGEEEVTNFIKAYLCIPNVMKYVNNTWIMNDNPQDSEARLENIEKYFNNDFKELKDIISYQPNNKVKVMFGVRTADDNKQYQTVYTQMCLRNNTNDYSKLEKDLQERKTNGAYSTTEFEAKDIHEYVSTPTNFTNSASDLPFEETKEDPWF